MDLFFRVLYYHEIFWNNTYYAMLINEIISIMPVTSSTTYCYFESFQKCIKKVCTHVVA